MNSTNNNSTYTKHTHITTKPNTFKVNDRLNRVGASRTKVVIGLIKLKVT